MSDISSEQFERLIEAVTRISNPPVVRVGFHDLDRPKFVFVKHEGDYVWYSWDHDNDKAEPIREQALTGTIVDLQRHDKEFQGQPKPKVRLTVKADQTYVLQTGLDSVFGKGLLFALDKLDAGQLRSELTIVPQGNDPKENGGLATVFCNLYVGKDKVITDNWDKSAGIEQLAELLTGLQDRMGFTQREDGNGAGNGGSEDGDETPDYLKWVLNRLAEAGVPKMDYNGAFEAMTGLKVKIMKITYADAKKFVTAVKADPDKLVELAARSRIPDEEFPPEEDLPF